MKIDRSLRGIWLACGLFAIAFVDANVINVCQTTEALAAQCPPNGHKPLECCPDENQATTTTPELMARSATVADVSSHRNVGLINPDHCGLTFAGERIIGGEKTGVFEMPWMALLKYRFRSEGITEEDFKCGGTLINDRYILTAAHCILNSPLIKLLSVRLGEHDTSKDQDCQDMVGTRVCAPPPQNIDVETMIRHPHYNSTTYANDIALIRLAENADKTKNTINPICLPVGLDAQDKDLDDDMLIVAGWGLAENGTASPDLLKVTLPVVPNERCRTVIAKYGYPISTNQLCAGGTNLTQDSCTGDSGGPLKKFGEVNGEGSMIQYGVVSYGHIDCGREGVPGVYTRVGPYMEWILDNIQP